MRTFSIVIPTFNHYALLHQVLFDVYQKCSPVLEVIVVDDGSTDVDYHQGLAWWKSTNMLPLKVLRMKENSGFLKSSNAGLKKAQGDIVCLLSNDVRIYKDFVSYIQGFDPIELLLFGGRLLDWDTGWNKFDNQMFPYLEGWLLAAHQTMWFSLGYLDERYMPNDFEDIDLSTNALTHGFSLIPIPEDYTKHIGGQSLGYNPEREAITNINREKFRQKWIK